MFKTIKLVILWIFTVNTQSLWNVPRTQRNSIDSFLRKKFGDNYIHETLPYRVHPHDHDRQNSEKSGNFSNFAVVTDDLRCSRVGRDVLNLGGNAVDAAVSLELCLSVINMHATGIGGGGRMVIYMNREVKYLDYRERAPANVSITNMKGMDQVTGVKSVAIPGMIKGLYDSWKLHGRLKWSDLVAPSVAIAHLGFRMHKLLYFCGGHIVPKILKSPYLRKMLIHRRKFKRVGDNVTNLKLAETLMEIARDPNSFYNGSIGKLLVEDIKNSGGIITRKDLANFRTLFKKPLAYRLTRNLTVFTSGSKSGGPMMAMMLNIMKELKFNHRNMTNRISKHKLYHYLVESFKFAFGHRNELLSAGNNLNRILSKSYTRRLIRKISPTTTFSPTHYGTSKNSVIAPINLYGTSHSCIIDSDGNAVSVTSSINHLFGSKFVSKSTGIILNNHMADFNRVGLKSKNRPPRLPMNDIGPNKVPASATTPTLVVDGNKRVKLILGASGGPLIVTSVAQVLINIIFMKMSVPEAIRHWRLHHQLIPNRFSLVKLIIIHFRVQYEGMRRPPLNVLIGLKKFGHRLRRIPANRISAVNVIKVVYDGLGSSNKKIIAGSDSRKAIRTASGR